jgi:hypothetical protein
MVIFHSYVSLPEGKACHWKNKKHGHLIKKVGVHKH